MAQAQLIQGTGAELIAYLEKHRNLRNLLLIIPEEAVSDQARNPYPKSAIIRNGVPLFPTEGRTQSITMERIRELLDEEE